MTEHPGNFICNGSQTPSLGPGVFRELPVIPVRPKLPPEMEGFELCESIGTGSTGTVYRSVQTREYAVKAVPLHLREIAKREYDVAVLFNDCETVIHVLAYYEHDSYSLILQELGEPVIDHFFRHPCSLRTLLMALLDVSDALRCIHSKGYTHFDVKPGNILIVKDRARLGDFSHCLKYVPGQEYDRSMGTSAFMAPEIKSGALHSGLEDMYSLGITMYALLMAGMLPFEGKNAGNGQEKEMPRISTLFIHPDLLSIIRKAAAPDPKERYQAFEGFSEEIRSFMEAHQDDLDEKVPGYLPSDPRRPTLPPFCDAHTARTDLS